MVKIFSRLQMTANEQYADCGKGHSFIEIHFKSEMPDATNVTQSLTAAANPGGPNGNRGAATSAQLNQPNGMAVDSTGNLYVIDSGNHRIRRVMPAGIISMVAGNGIDSRPPNVGAFAELRNHLG